MSASIIHEHESGDETTSKIYYIFMAIITLIIVIVLISNTIYLNNAKKDVKNVDSKNWLGLMVWVNAIFAVIVGLVFIWTLVKLFNPKHKHTHEIHYPTMPPPPQGYAMPPTVQHQGAPVQTQPFYSAPPQQAPQDGMRQRPKPQPQIRYEPVVSYDYPAGTSAGPSVQNQMQQQQSTNGMSPPGEEY
jgi:heme/copper-type cytochrome/quinol oxidase subunit 2